MGILWKFVADISFDLCLYTVGIYVYIYSTFRILGYICVSIHIKCRAQSLSFVALKLNTNFYIKKKSFEKRKLFLYVKHTTFHTCIYVYT